MLLEVKLTKRLQLGQTNESFNLGRVEGRNIKQTTLSQNIQFSSPNFRLKVDFIVFLHH